MRAFIPFLAQAEAFNWEELFDFSRRYPVPLPAEVAFALPQKEFIRYCREHLWYKKNPNFDQLSPSEKYAIDLDVCVDLLKAFKTAEGGKE